MGPADECYHVELVGYNTIFCDPEGFPGTDDIRGLSTRGLTVLVRVHLKKAPIWEADQQHFLDIESHGLCYIGEVGLDYTAAADPWEAQEQ